METILENNWISSVNKRDRTMPGGKGSDIDVGLKHLFKMFKPFILYTCIFT